MTDLYRMSPYFIYGVFSASLILLAHSGPLTIRSFLYSFGKKIRILSLLLCLSDFIFYQSLKLLLAALQSDDEIMIALFGSYPYFIPLLIIFILGICSILLEIYARKRKKDLLTEHSIKSAVDDFPSGIMVYDENGIILLINRKMNEIAGYFGSANPFDGKKAEQLFFSHRIKEEEEPVVSAGEHFYLLRKSVLFPEEKKQATELCAIDITEQYLLKEKAKEEAVYLQKYNDALRNYHENIVKVTTEEEILNTKIKIHDKLGELLLLSKDKNAELSEDYRKNLLHQWKETYAQLANYQLSSTHDTSYLDDLISAGNAIGVRIIIDSPVPDSAIVYTFIHECLTNTYKHGHGNAMTLTILPSKDKYILRASNNGAKAESIEFRGGLKSLNELVSKSRGTLEFLPEEKEFTLQMTLPKGALNLWKK